MISSIDHIKQVWSALLDKTGAKTEIAKVRICGTTRFGGYFAIRYDSHLPALEFGPVTTDLLKESPLPDIKGIEYGLWSHNGQQYLSIHLKQPDTLDIFLMLAARLTESLAGDLRPVSGYSIVRKVLITWKKFFSNEMKLLTIPQQTGLAGELTIARLLIEHGFDANKVIQGWKGAERSHHDFHLEEAAIEIKATVAHNTDSVTITSLRQLDSTGTPRLYMAQVAFDAHDQGTHSLPDMVADTRALLSEFPASKLEFDEKLLKSGYRDKDEDHYINPSYQVRKIKVFNVDENFPRLTSYSVPDGIFDVGYKVNLASVNSKSLSFDELLTDIRGPSND
jgi:hypothetical protein